VSGRAAGVAAALAAVAIAPALGLMACGEKEERVPGTSRAEVSALVAAGLGAVGSNAAPPAFAFRADGALLRIRLAAPPEGGALLDLAESFRSVRADIQPFCPKPALLRCRPSLRAWASPRSRHAVERSVSALRRLAARTYDARSLVKRDRHVTRIVTANGELLAAVRASGAIVRLSFGGLDPPRAQAGAPMDGLEAEADADALAAMRQALPPAARRALAGVRRLVVSAPLP
jgi:hypothetical protein